MDRFLRNEILAPKPLDPKQHGHQTGMFVETELRQLLVRIEKALDQQEIALGVFLNIECAFSSTSYDSMCAELVQNVVYYTIVRWFGASQEDRLATVNLGGFSRSVLMSRGCPVLSPLLWGLVINELLAGLNEGGVCTQVYADDISVIAVGKFPSTIGRAHTMSPSYRRSVA